MSRAMSKVRSTPGGPLMAEHGTIGTKARRKERGEDAPSPARRVATRSVPAGLQGAGATLDAVQKGRVDLDRLARSVIGGPLGPGDPLPPNMKGSAEASLGTALDHVRLHRGPGPDRMMQGLGAVAAQVGAHLLVRSDRYAPDTRAGRAVIGHELVHAAQLALAGPGARPISSPSDASEAEARRLGPAVLSGRALSQPPAVPASARVNLQGTEVSSQMSSMPPSVCDPNFSDSGASSSPAPLSSEPNASYGPAPAAGEGSDSAVASSGGFCAAESSNAVSSYGEDSCETPLPDDGGNLRFTVDPSRIDARSLSNRELVETGIDARERIGNFRESSPETMAWKQLEQEVEDERLARVELGFVFMAAAREGLPTAIMQLVPGDVPGATGIYVADPEIAFGPKDTHLAGVIMTPAQLNEYLASSGLMEAKGEAAARAMQILQSGDTSAFANEFAAADPRPQMTARGSSLARNPFAYDALTINPDPSFAIPYRNESGIQGLAGEAFFNFGAEQGFGAFSRDFNAPDVNWINVAGQRQSGRNAPVFDTGRAVPFMDMQRVSVGTTTQENQARAVRAMLVKISHVLDVPGRRMEAMTQVTNSPDMAANHVRQMTGDPGLNVGSDAFAAAQRTHLPEVFFAVPEAQVAEMRAALAQPHVTPADGGRRPMSLDGYRALYDQILRETPIRGQDGHGNPVEIASMSQLVERLPNYMRRESDPRPAGGPGLDALTRDSRADVMAELGRRAKARIIATGEARAMIASADSLRGVGEGSAATPTRVLQMNIGNFAARGRRIDEGLRAVRSAEHADSVTFLDGSAVSASDRFLSAARMHTGNQNLQRGTPEFAAARNSLIQQALYAMPADLRAPVMEEIATGNSELVRDIRTALVSEMTVAQADSDVIVLADSMMRTTGNADRATLRAVTEHFTGLRDAHGNEGAVARQNPDSLSINLARRPGGRTTQMRHSLGQNAFGNLVGYLTTGALEYGVNDRVVMPGAGQIAVDMGVGVTSEFAERGVGNVMVRSLAHSTAGANLLGNTGARSVLSKAGPGFVVQPLVSVGMGMWAAHEDAEMYRQIGFEMSDDEYQRRLTHDAGVGVAGALGTLGVVGAYALAGSAVGPVGTLVGIIVGAGAAWIANEALPDSREDFLREHQARLEAQDRERRERMWAQQAGEIPLSTMEAGRVPLPFRESNRISAQEQRVIANWFLQNAQPAAPYGPPLPQGWVE